MNWTYKNEEIQGISDFPDNTYGFIYMITHLPSGKAYIGKKVLQHTRKVKLPKTESTKFTSSSFIIKCNIRNGL